MLLPVGLFSVAPMKGLLAAVFDRLRDGCFGFRPRYLSISSNACRSKSWQKSSTVVFLDEGFLVAA